MEPYKTTNEKENMQSPTATSNDIKQRRKEANDENKLQIVKANARLQYKNIKVRCISVDCLIDLFFNSLFLPASVSRPALLSLLGMQLPSAPYRFLDHSLMCEYTVQQRRKYCSISTSLFIHILHNLSSHGSLD